MKHPPEFTLQFDPSEIDALAERYGAAQDDDALLAGKQIASGNYSRDDLKIIVNWKSPRRAALLDDNKDGDIAIALQFAAALTTPEAMAVAVLTALHGVGIPMASAIVTAINPERYTVLDYRALESLGIANWPDTLDFYVAYLEACRQLARSHGTTLRTLDRALWQWSKENSGTTEHHIRHSPSAQFAVAANTAPSMLSLSNKPRQLVMQEVLSKPGYENLPRSEWEFYELCIEEADDVWRPGFIVKQTHAQWIEIDRQVMWEEPEWVRWPTLKSAQRQYENWRNALQARGFARSDMTF